MDFTLDEIHTESESDADDGEFYFESDHLALRNNPDYTSVLRTLTVLEAQRIQATKDLEKLAEIEKLALKDPLNFIQKLTSKDESNSMPDLINIAEIPKIDFQKYNVTIPQESLYYSDEIKKDPQQLLLNLEQKIGETHKQNWTSEEQRRLEELLVEYPSETFEMRRFVKISRALGNRTPKQVASRVQKYFKKLHSAGMPIPGRIPKAQRNSMTKNIKFNKLTFRPSTFFPIHDVPVTMPEDDDCVDFSLKNLQSTSNSVISFDKEKYMPVDSDSDDSNGKDSIKSSSKNRILKLLERIKNDKERDKNNRPESIHVGYKCNQCLEEPIKGTRWHCKTCIQQSIDFCSDCLVNQLLSDKQHPIEHGFSGLRLAINELNKGLDHSDSDSNSDGCQEDIKIENMFSNYDKDYMLSKFSKEEHYNYLDPNFLFEK